MDRKQFLRLTGMAGCGGALAGCEAMDELAKKPEGSGVQVLGAVVFLAKYKATSNQRAEAKRKAARYYVDRQLKPAYDSLVAKIDREASSNVRSVPPEKKSEILAEAKQEKVLAQASFHEEVGRSPYADVVAGMSLPVAKPRVDADPSVTRRLRAEEGSYESPILLAMQVSGAGHSVERQNPSLVTVVTTNSKTGAIGQDAYVLKDKPRSGDKLSLDGKRAVFQN